MTAGERSFVSVIVPVRNGERTIAACLEALLRQDYPRDRYEVIVVDNRSTDRTVDIVQPFPVQSLREVSQQSAYAARNRGIAAAQGTILAFTDADCVASPSWLARGVAGFDSDGIGGVAGEIVPAPPRTLAQRYCAARHSISQRAAMEHEFRPYAQTGSAFYRRAIVEAIGPFDPSLISGGDADFSWRMQAAGFALRFVPEAVVEFEHRRSLRALLRQRQAYGYGSVLLYLKYREQMGRRTLKHTYWELRALGRKVWRLLRQGVARLWPARARRRDDESMLLGVLGILVIVARKIGQLRGSIRHRVWYV